MQDEKCISRRPQSRKKMKWGICPSMYVLMSMERLGHSEHCSYKKQPLCSYILFFFLMHINSFLSRLKGNWILRTLFTCQSSAHQKANAASLPGYRVQEVSKLLIRGVVIQWLLWVDTSSTPILVFVTVANNTPVVFLFLLNHSINKGEAIWSTELSLV